MDHHLKNDYTLIFRKKQALFLIFSNILLDFSIMRNYNMIPPNRQEFLIKDNTTDSAGYINTGYARRK